MKSTVLMIVGLIFCSCLTVDGPDNRLTAANKKLAQSMSYKNGNYLGFTINRDQLSNKNWIHPLEHHKPYFAISILPQASLTHTFNAQAKLNRQPPQIKTVEQLKSFQEANFTHLDSRHQPIKSNFTIVEIDDVEHVKYEIEVYDKGASANVTPLIMKISGYTCIHPSKDGFILDYYYSERGTKQDIERNFYTKDGLEFLNAIEINSL